MNTDARQAADRLELTAQILALLEGDLDETERGLLVARIEHEPQVRDLYIDVAHSSAGLCWNHAHRISGAHEFAAMQGSEQPGEPAVTLNNGRLSRWWETTREFAIHPTSLSLLVAGLFTTVVLLALAVWTLPMLVPSQPAGPRAPRVVAEVTRSIDARWSPETDLPSFAGGELLEGQPAELLAGLVELKFRSGAVLLLEGPCRVEAVSSSRIRLDDGRLTARVPQQAVGFAVKTPLAEVVDLGTEFGVAVHDDGSEQVAVFDGQVQLNHRGQPGPVLAAGQARAITAESIEPLEAQDPATQYVRQWPRERSISINFYGQGQEHNRLEPGGMLAGVPAAHWNQMACDNSGTPATMGALVDDEGRATAARVEVDAQAAWEVRLGSIDGPAQRMQHGYWDTGVDGAGRITIRDLPPDFTTHGYRIYVYVHGTDGMGDGTAAEFGAGIGDEVYWLRWIKHGADSRFSRSLFTGEQQAQESLSDDNVLVFDKGGELFFEPVVNIDIYGDPDAGGASWGRAAVSAVRIVRRAVASEPQARDAASLDSPGQSRPWD